MEIVSTHLQYLQYPHNYIPDNVLIAANLRLTKQWDLNVLRNPVYKL